MKLRTTLSESTRRMAKVTKEHRICPNNLHRNFKQGVAGKVLLTDITYLTYGGSKRAYLSTIKDAKTNEILAYEVSSTLGIAIALNTLHKLKKHHHLREPLSIRIKVSTIRTQNPSLSKENELRAVHVTQRKLLG